MTGLEGIEHLLINIVAERTKEQPWLFEDALQEARLAAWQRFEEGHSRFIAARGARQAVTDVVRGRRMTGSKSTAGHLIGAHGRADSINGSSTEGEDYEIPLPDHGTTQDIDQIDARAALHQAMEPLSPRERRIVWLRYYEGLELKEVATEIGVTHQRISQILKAAHAKMRAVLETA